MEEDTATNATSALGRSECVTVDLMCAWWSEAPGSPLGEDTDEAEHYIFFSFSRVKGLQLFLSR